MQRFVEDDDEITFVQKLRQLLVDELDAAGTIGAFGARFRFHIDSFFACTDTAARHTFPCVRPVKERFARDVDEQRSAVANKRVRT